METTADYLSLLPCGLQSGRRLPSVLQAIAAKTPTTAPDSTTLACGCEVDPSTESTHRRPPRYEVNRRCLKVNAANPLLSPRTLGPLQQSIFPSCDRSPVPILLLSDFSHHQQVTSLVDFLLFAERLCACF